jgi:RNA polymerase sigma-70 factor (ECF subfamily)
MAYDPRLTAEPDAELLARAGSGHPAAAAELYRRHSAAVYRFVWASTGSEAEASDVVQESFVAVLERPARFDPARGSCTAYLCGIARHLVYRRYDARIDPGADVDELVESQGQAPALPAPPEVAERAQALARLYAAIRALPPGFRDVLILVELQEMSYADAAAIVGIELGTVRSRLARARARLAELLGASSASSSGESA